MTIPSEEVRALERTRGFMRSLLTKNLTEIRKNAKDIRAEARSCLKHYPWQMHIDELWKERIRKMEPWTNEEDLTLPPVCRKCSIEMKEGQAIEQTWTSGIPDFIGESRGITMSLGGSGKVINCWKCPKCGHSITK